MVRATERMPGSPHSRLGLLGRSARRRSTDRLRAGCLLESSALCNAAAPAEPAIRAQPALGHGSGKAAFIRRMAAWKVWAVLLAVAAESAAARQPCPPLVHELCSDGTLSSAAQAGVKKRPRIMSEVQRAWEDVFGG